MTSEAAERQGCSARIRSNAGHGALPLSGCHGRDPGGCREPGRLPGAAADVGAYHDALFLAAAAPTAMLFVPCRDGLSHNEAEFAEPADIAAGAQVLV